VFFELTQPHQAGRDGGRVDFLDFLEIDQNIFVKDAVFFDVGVDPNGIIGKGIFVKNAFKADDLNITPIFNPIDLIRQPSFLTQNFSQ